ncbi:MAG: hypothetical protein AB7Q17_17795 [Phycisphaerae bacterium]
MLHAGNPARLRIALKSRQELLRGMRRPAPGPLQFNLIVPFFLLLSVMAVVALRVMSYAYQRCESDASPDKCMHTGSLWSAYVKRLQGSLYETTDALGGTVRESDHVLVGINLLSDYPVLMHRDIPRGHLHLTGDTGSGKSALGLANLIHQLVNRPNTSTVILDLKGDPALFHGVRSETRCKWFTNQANRSTYAFNVFAQEHFTRVTQHQKTELLLKSLGLDYGEGSPGGCCVYSLVRPDRSSSRP